MPRVDLTYLTTHPALVDGSIIDTLRKELPGIITRTLRIGDESWTEVRIHEADERNVNTRPIAIEVMVSRAATRVDVLNAGIDAAILALKEVVPVEFQGSKNIGVHFQLVDGSYDTL